MESQKVTLPAFFFDSPTILWFLDFELEVRKALMVRLLATSAISTDRSTIDQICNEKAFI